MRWEADGRTVAVLWDVASRIRSKRRTSSLCSLHLAFSQIVLFFLAIMLCIHIVVEAQLPLGRNPVLFYQIRFPYDR